MNFLTHLFFVRAAINHDLSNSGDLEISERKHREPDWSESSKRRERERQPDSNLIFMGEIHEIENLERDSGGVAASHHF